MQVTFFFFSKFFIIYWGTLQMSSPGPKPLVPNSPRTNHHQVQSPKETGADNKFLQATHPHHHPQLFSMNQGSHNKAQRVRTCLNGPLYLSTKNLLIAPVSKYQHPGQTKSVQKEPNAGVQWQCGLRHVVTINSSTLFLSQY